MCLYSKIIKNKKYVPNKKNRGNVPTPNDRRVLAVPIKCGKCIECMKQKSREWQVRLLEDVRHHKNGKFITLTFSNESIKKLYKELQQYKGYELDNQIARLATRRFLERWRAEYKTSIRHWLVTELGHQGTENIHMHGILWTNEKTEKIEKLWKYGYIWVGSYVNEKTANYITKYITKQDERHKEYQPKIFTSAGIGKGYISRLDSRTNTYKPIPGTTNEVYKTRTGHKINLPIYWRNKIYTEQERERLWIEKLNKNERWVCGEKIDTSKGMQEYYKALRYHRKRAKKLGYQSDESNWNQKLEEEKRRQYNLEQRLKD